MNRLWVRLTLSHMAVALVIVAVVTLVAGQFIELTLRREAARQLAIKSGIIERLPQLANPLEAGNPNRAGRMAPPLIIADATGTVLHDWHGEAGRKLTLLERRLAVRIVRDGKTVAYLLPVSVGNLTREYAALLRTLRQAVFATAIAAGFVAVVSSLILSENIAGPLRKLVGGARAIAAGDLNRRIEPTGPDETRELAEAFNQMGMALAEAEQRRRELTADIAHELRTPLTVLQGNLSAMLDGVYTPTKKEIAALYDEVLRLSHLVQDLGQLAEFDAGQLHLDLRPIDVHPLLQRTVSLFGPAAEAQGVTLDAVCPPDLPFVLADATRAGQVLDNLVSNALRHTPAGGKIEIGARPREQAVEISVTDTGEGIPAPELPRVFERFWRADRSRSRSHGGSGLGLAIAKQLVEAMNGTIGVESENQQGSHFWFTLPLASDTQLKRATTSTET